MGEIETLAPESQMIGMLTLEEVAADGVAKAKRGLEGHFEGRRGEETLRRDGRRLQLLQTEVVDGLKLGKVGGKERLDNHMTTLVRAIGTV